MLWIRGAKTRVINFELVQPINMPTVHQRYRRTDRRTTYGSNTALSLRASRGRKEREGITQSHKSVISFFFWYSAAVAGQ